MRTTAPVLGAGLPGAVLVSSAYKRPCESKASPSTAVRPDANVEICPSGVTPQTCSEPGTIGNVPRFAT